MLQYIGFNDATRIISDQELKFSPLNFAYTQAWMTINDVDAPYQLNDINGNFILFKLIPSTTAFANILVELLERMKRVLNITIPLAHRYNGWE